MASEKTRLLSDSIITIPVSIHSDGLEFFDKSKGLSLEELMQFQDDPWWINLRKTFFFSFWLTLIFIFSTACLLSIIQHGSCPVNNKTEMRNLNYKIVSKENSTAYYIDKILTTSTTSNNLVTTTEILTNNLILRK